MTVRWRIPDVSDTTFGFDANLTEVGVGERGVLYRRFEFDEVVTVKADEWLEIDDDGAQWLCNAEGRQKQLTGKWIKINEEVENHELG